MLLAAGAGTTATAKGWEVGGSGSTYFLSDSFSVESNIDFVYGRAADQVYVGDWDGDGTDTLAARRGNEYHVKNTLDGGNADTAVHYGRADDTVLVGDWDGDRR